ncbi:hypothetical protein EFK50_19445 [Nocardioides marmoriginsengisoli]|uniref:Uncharacterized protein n=1 Tax=Nocardioides marmoriginsengisoli TaxID=661483 RepID=A0A3N0CB15_9ACTN|nr:hypothetical protein [Nocardioides marmoriginsengisoli]RNL60499.1 hypothetical protein EFK50_19445 [Nocardioides marmoriginsengisoli]
MTSNRTFAALALAGALALSACSSTEVDSDGRWVGGAKTMTAWADSHIPATWDRVDQSVTYGDIIDDFGNDTKRDTTDFAGSYRGVTESEFAEFGKSELKLRQDLECEPYDPELATPEEKPYLKNCYLSLYQGQRPLPPQFDLFAVWTDYPDGTTTTLVYLTNSPD